MGPTNWRTHLVPQAFLVSEEKWQLRDAQIYHREAWEGKIGECFFAGDFFGFWMVNKGSKNKWPPSSGLKGDFESAGW